MQSCGHLQDTHDPYRLHGLVRWVPAVTPLHNGTHPDRKHRPHTVGGTRRRQASMEAKNWSSMPASKRAVRWPSGSWPRSSAGQKKSFEPTK